MLYPNIIDLNYREDFITSSPLEDLSTKKEMLTLKSLEKSRTSYDISPLT